MPTPGTTRVNQKETNIVMRKIVTIAAAPIATLLFAATSHAAATSFGGEGTYTVGGDIQPGIYHTSGPSGDIDCYWERDSDLSGTTDSIIANNLSSGPQTVRISSTDAAFQTKGCAPWVLTAPVLAPAPAPAPPPDPAPAPAPATGSFGG